MCLEDLENLTQQDAIITLTIIFIYLIALWWYATRGDNES